MKPNNLLLLAVALSTTLFMVGCDRDRDVEPAANAATTPAVEPAPAMEPAPAPEPAPAVAMTDSGMSFTDMDKNMDSGITHDELADSEMLHQHFNEADTDGDGKLSLAEVEKHRADMAAMPGG